MTYLAVLSPLAGGLAWAAINVAAVTAFQDQPDSDLSVFGLAISGLVLGVLGAVILAVVVIAGLCAREDRGRLGAAAAGATVSVIGGVTWFAIILGNGDFNTNLTIGLQVSTIPLFAPAVLVGWMFRSRRQS